MLSKARQKKIMEKLNRAQKCSILGPQNLGSIGGRAPPTSTGSAPEDLKRSLLIVYTACLSERAIGVSLN